MLMLFTVLVTILIIAAVAVAITAFSLWLAERITEWLP